MMTNVLLSQFDVNQSVLPEALHRFSEFFSAPLFLRDGMNRELKVIAAPAARSPFSPAYFRFECSFFHSLWMLLGRSIGIQKLYAARFHSLLRAALSTG